MGAGGLWIHTEGSGDVLEGSWSCPGGPQDGPGGPLKDQEAPRMGPGALRRHWDDLEMSQ